MKLFKIGWSAVYQAPDLSVPEDTNRTTTIATDGDIRRATAQLLHAVESGYSIPDGSKVLRFKVLKVEECGTVDIVDDDFEDESVYPDLPELETIAAKLSKHARETLRSWDAIGDTYDLLTSPMMDWIQDKDDQQVYDEIKAVVQEMGFKLNEREA